MASSGSGPPQPPVSQPAVTQPPAPQPAPGRVDNRPLSPWAERYGYGYSQDIWPTEPVRHSNIAPSHPPLHPKFYGDEPSEEGHGVFSSGYDKDRFFVTEYRSKSLRRAVESWQYGPLTRTLQFSDRGYVPGGHVSSLSGEAYIHRLIYETERIQVNEDSWFPFFKKNRWYSTAAYEPLLTGNSWSVDDPIIWGELSVALELANRILNTLIHDKHIFLQTILFGKLAYWEKAREYFPEQPAEPVQDATVLLSYPFYKARFTQVYPDTPCEMDHVMDLTNDQYRDMLCLLGSQQDWSLASLNFGDGDRSGGRTVTTQILNNFIMIDVDPIKSLIRNDLTLAERVAAMYELSNTILHELSHALINSRMRDDDSPLNGLRRLEDHAYEPFVDFGGQAEMGYAMETSLFGGPHRHVVTKGPNEIIFLPHRVNWPFPPLKDSSKGLGIVVPGHPAMAVGVENKLTLVPISWYSMILSEAFWQNESIPQKSDQFFFMPDYFCSRTPNPATGSVSEHRSRPILEHEPPLTNPGVVDMIENWKSRERLWKQIRDGWYDKEQDRWAKSPWGSTWREVIHMFTKQMNTPLEQRDMYECVTCAMALVVLADWSHGAVSYTGTIVTPSTWIYHTIGLLMLACIPLRPNGLMRSSQPPELAHYAFMPTSTTYPRKILRYSTWKSMVPVYDTAPASLYYDPLEGVGRRVYAKGAFDHVSYLDLISKLFKLFAENHVVVSTPWLQEILRVEEKIRKYRLNPPPVADSLDPDLTWAEDVWDFQIPEYDPKAESQWIDAMVGWGPV